MTDCLDSPRNLQETRSTLTPKFRNLFRPPQPGPSSDQRKVLRPNLCRQVPQPSASLGLFLCIISQFHFLSFTVWAYIVSLSINHRLSLLCEPLDVIRLLREILTSLYKLFVEKLNFQIWAPEITWNHLKSIKSVTFFLLKTFPPHLSTSSVQRSNNGNSPRRQLRLSQFDFKPKSFPLSFAITLTVWPAFCCRFNSAIKRTWLPNFWIFRIFRIAKIPSLKSLFSECFYMFQTTTPPFCNRTIQFNPEHLLYEFWPFIWFLFIRPNSFLYRVQLLFFLNEWPPLVTQNSRK